MKIGCSFPQSEIGPDIGGIRAYAQACDEMGFWLMTCGEHLVGVDTAARKLEKRAGAPKDLRDIAYPYQEPLTFFAFVAGITKRINFLTSVLIAPQRQTVLIAKQTAQVQNYSGGRLMLGIGMGWSEYEYESLGADFHTRGRRMEEQIHVLRELWSQRLVTHEGRYHTVKGIGINPLPQKTIPIWIGLGGNERPLRRAARLADGVMMTPSGSAARLNDFKGYVRDAGRDLSSISLSMNLNLNECDIPTAAKLTKQYAAEGFSHLIVYTTDLGFTSLDQHVKKLADYKSAVGPLS